MGTKSFYQNAEIWKDFGSIIEGSMPTDTQTPQMDDVHIYISANTLYVNSPVTGTVSVYSVKGELGHVFDKSIGERSFYFGKEQNKMLIVKNSTGKTKKVISK